MKELKSKGMAGAIPVFCSFDKIVPLDEMKPNPKNPNKHPQEQIDLLVKIIQAQGWRQPVKVSTRSGLIVSGHGRFEAAKLIGCPVPVDFQEYPGEDEELADLLADNRIAELADLDKAALAGIFQGLDTASIEASLTGYTGDEIDHILQAVNDSLSEDDFGHFFEDADAQETEEDLEHETEFTKRVQCPHCGEWFEV